MLYNFFISFFYRFLRGLNSVQEDVIMLYLNSDFNKKTNALKTNKEGEATITNVNILYAEIRSIIF
jgi:hypothetical protein